MELDLKRIQAYQQYDFAADEKYRTYISKFYPTPTQHILEKKKRKYYKEHVDKDFEPNFDNLNELVVL